MGASHIGNHQEMNEMLALAAKSGIKSWIQTCLKRAARKPSKLWIRAGRDIDMFSLGLSNTLDLLRIAVLT